MLNQSLTYNYNIINNFENLVKFQNFVAPFARIELAYSRLPPERFMCLRPLADRPMFYNVTIIISVSSLDFWVSPTISKGICASDEIRTHTDPSAQGIFLPHLLS